MNEQITEYLAKFSEETVALFTALRELILEIQPSAEEKLWAKLPSYYVGESFVRLIAFKDHINVEAKAIPQFAEELSGYKITPKGMLQIYSKDQIPCETLKKAFAETLK